MSRKKKLQPFESIRRDIARRLQAGLPLAGMIAATTLLCGCDELTGGKTAGIAPREDAAVCEQQTERPKPVRSKSEPNAQNETENKVPRGKMTAPPPNQKNETVDPASTMGRYPATPGKPSAGK